ncbi:MAG: efflux RND transporter periplasmic adaptor subunit [Patescibacteria group bacterium]
MNPNTLEKTKLFFLRKNFLVPAFLLVVVLVVLFLKNGDNITFAKVESKTGNLIQTVRATGQVTSETDLSLFFNKQGVVKKVSVKVGDKVSVGQVLAMLDSKSEYAKVTEARGSLLAAKARLQKVIEGATNEEINLAQVALTNAKRDYQSTKSQQDTLVANAYNKVLNSVFEATPVGSGVSTSAPTISGVYKLGKEGTINLSVYSTGDGLKFSTSGLATEFGSVSTTTPQMVGSTGLYLVFPTSSNLSGTNFTISIPNKNASDYLANENAYKSAIETREVALSSATALIDQKNAELDLKLAKARNSDIDLARADVVSAEGGLEQAQANYENNIIRAPKAGTVTKIDIKDGEIADAKTGVIDIQDVENLYVEVLINESNIANITLNQPVDVTFDALGDLAKFTGVVVQIDPSSVTTDGIVNYKIKVSINEKDPNIRPGMNSEVSIVTLNKENVFSIPKAAIFDKEGKSYVSVVTNEKSKKYKEVEVVTGLVGDGNMVEVLSGVTSIDYIAIVTKN